MRTEKAILGELARLSDQIRIVDHYREARLVVIKEARGMDPPIKLKALAEACQTSTMVVQHMITRAKSR